MLLLLLSQGMVWIAHGTNDHRGDTSARDNEKNFNLNDLYRVNYSRRYVLLRISEIEWINITVTQISALTAVANSAGTRFSADELG